MWSDVKGLYSYLVCISRYGPCGFHFLGKAIFNSDRHISYCLVDKAFAADRVLNNSPFIE